MTPENPVRKTILVVDDTAENLLLMSNIFKGEYRVLLVNSGEKALKAAVFDPPPDLILLDIMMPGLDGYEVCRQIMADEKTRDIPVIFLTAMSEVADEKLGLELGAVDYITKPFSPAIVLARVKTQLALKNTAEALRQSNAFLRETQDELVRSEKLAALGSMVAGVAHELNTPIGNSLMVASHIAECCRKLNDSLVSGLRRSMLDEHLANVTSGAAILVSSLTKAAELVSSFKQVSADQASSQRRSFKLAEVVAEISAMMASAIRHKPIALVQEIPAEFELDSFPGPLGQVLINLINNAVLHGLDGRERGEIRVTASATGDGRQVAVSVSDDGKGIPEDILPRVFDPFFTTRLGSGGSGLGLNITHNIVTGVLGGRIAVASKLGEGTSFTLTLPLVAPSIEKTVA